MLVVDVLLLCVRVVILAQVLSGPGPAETAGSLASGDDRFVSSAIGRDKQLAC
jgi:hypothetical protein